MMHKLIHRIALLLVCLLLSVPLVSAQDATLLDVIQDNAQFSTFAEVIERTDVANTLAATEASLTVFAPTNAAFESMSPVVFDYLQSNPDLLARIIRHHIVESTLASDAMPADPVPSLAGSSLVLTTDEMDMLVDGVSLTMTDVNASNGILHGINNILLPPIDVPTVDPLFVSGDIDIAGSSTVFPLTTRIRDEFVSAGYSDQIEVESIGTGGGFERFCIATEIDIVNASRPIHPAERDNCHANNRTPVAFRVGVDALAVVVSQQNDFIDSLTLDQLVQVFSTAETWSDVNADWPDEPISRFIPGTDSGTFDYFVEEVFAGDEASILNASNRRLSEDDEVLANDIINNPYGIGFFGFAYYNQQRNSLRAVAIDNIIPTSATAENGAYPLARPLFIYSAPEIIADAPQTADFINYYLQTVSDVITDVGYFPASPQALNRARLHWLAITDVR